MTLKAKVIEQNGTFRLSTEQLVGGWARVYRKNWTHPTYCSVSFEEVAQKKGDGQLNKNWAGKGATMVEKVAKVRALRETFIEDLGGMYEAEEMGVDLPKDNLVQSNVVIEQNEPIDVEYMPVDDVVSMDAI